MIEKGTRCLRDFMVRAAGNVSLFVFLMFLMNGVLCMEPLVWYRTQVEMIKQYVLFPWGMALCLLRLERRRAADLTTVTRDVQVLFVLVLWIFFPFILRFGPTFNNMSAWYDYTVVYFGVYAFLREKGEAEREALFDMAALLFSALSFVLCGALLYCAATAQTFYFGAQSVGFGLNGGAHICHGVHYNITGMTCLSMAMMCCAGAARSRRMPLRVFCGVSAAMAFAVIVLTQSRTARYAALIALSVGAYGSVLACVRLRSRIRCQLAAVCTAAAVLVGGFAAASVMTDMALSHYAQVLSAREEGKTYGLADMLVSGAIADDGEETVQPQQARKAIDSTFSDRTRIWSNLFRLWLDNPRHMLIGNGVGRTGSRIVEGTIHEAAGSVQVHNTYLQHTADFGLIGSALLAAFFILIAKPALRVFFARGEARRPGYTALCMLVIAALATGMMESAPLGGMTTVNVTLFFALALIAARGEALL